MKYAPARKGDVRHSRADISAVRLAFGDEPTMSLEEELVEYIYGVTEEGDAGKIRGCEGY